MNIIIIFGDAKVAFCQQHETVAWDLVCCNCFADDFFAAAVGVDVGCIPSVDAAVVGVFE